MNLLEKYSGFKAELAIAETFDEIKLIESKAAAAAEFARKNKIGIDEQNQWGRFRTEIERKKGIWLDENFPHKGTGANQYKSAEVEQCDLSKMPVTKGESSQARLIKNKPDFAEDVMKELESKDKIITPNAVSSGIRKRQREERFKNLSISEMPKDKYRVIYADPPWKYNDKCEEGAIQSGGVERHYLTMTINELCLMELPKIEDNAVLFLWVTSPLLEESFEIIKAWGFKYKSSFVWDKIKHNMGHYNSVRHEFLLIAIKGSCQPDVKKLFDSVQSIERTKHSEKPEKFREIIDMIYPNGKRIELFARVKVPDNWDSWGNEI